MDDTSAAAGSEKRSEEHTSELQSLAYLVCRLLLEKKKLETRACPFRRCRCVGRQKVSESKNPLISNRCCRRECNGRPAQPAEYFESEDGFPRCRRCHDVNPAIN